MIEKIELEGELRMNCYFIIHEKDCYIVDPGYHKEQLRKYVNQRGLIVQGILLTHAHMDHIGALDAFPVPVYLHPADRPLFEDDNINGFAAYNKTKPYPPKSISFQDIQGGDRIPFKGSFIETIHTPGHTPGGICYKWDNEMCTGDTIFAGSVGRWDFPLGSQKDLSQSVLQIIGTMDEGLILHPGHGLSTTVGKERLGNVCYRQWRGL